ncbi:ABC transporter substrate-binding protein [Hyalangium sp.]|uniref:MlaC/ttg2D family ABC transporter substrate-binding protein n=1 Tax=Hyalangium sp. TaxID=2028555 RepID=UPI002D2FC4FB|nr:ABC transporter substrate-binding protein [Hyalangium sp.]HYH95423.1 ABC transporter substrate-binding protein [Hyalangium sp.]
MLIPLIAATLLASTPSPLEVVKSGYANVQKVASAPGATVEKLATAVDTFVDFNELARRALGETWNTLTPAQRKEFTGAMRGMLRAFYAQRILGTGQTAITYGEETLNGDEAIVRTTVTVERTQLPIAYKLYRQSRKPRGWRIYDIVTGNTSLLEDYRVQFNELLVTQGFNGLLATVKARRAQVENLAPSRKAPAAK